MTRTSAVVCLLGLIGWSGPAGAENTLPPLLQKVSFDQRLDVQVPLDVPLVDESGRQVRLGDYFGSKPVILTLVYYRCPMLCTLVLNGLAQSMLDLPFDAGRDFEVVTVSFDARETPELAAAKKQTYLDRYGRPGAAKGWHFLVGPQASIDRLTAAVGFRAVYDPQRDEFAHASGIVVLTPAGRIARYFYDVKYSARDLRLGLVEAGEGQISSPIDRILLFCFHYDPSEGKYGTTIMSLVRLGGVITLLSVAALVAGLWIREYRRGAGRRAAAGHLQAANVPGAAAALPAALPDAERT
ncbi:MAG TPA: SCO family protein [Pirellulales bacterium]|nr:SCO family protein [Pirellulales bacterium]